MESFSGPSPHTLSAILHMSTAFSTQTSRELFILGATVLCCTKVFRIQQCSLVSKQGLHLRSYKLDMGTERSI
jgi:hypothetical protein